MMLHGVGSCVKNEISANERFKNFAAKSPFAAADFFTSLSAAEREMLQKKADSFLQHQFDLLGSGPVCMGEKIDWHSDFVTGFRWDPSRLYSEVRRLTPSGSDIKRPWELSRCQHFISLGLAWRLFGKEKYRDEFISEIEDWIAQNPVGFGVNWTCPMDVAIRAVNWLSGYALFCSALSSAEYPEFRKKLTVSLWEHARFIEAHLEWNGPFSERRANHFLANLTGLFTLGIFFSDTNSGRRWMRFSHKWLEKEMQRQVLNDGVHFECSISYHRLCLEMFMWCYHLSVQNDVPFNGEYKKRLQNMRVFSRAYTRPDGMAPLFGDNDDGRLLSSRLGHINDHRYLWNNALIGASATDAALFVGNERSSIKAVSGLSAFEAAGFYVIQRTDVHLIVRAGRLAHIGTHAHCDQLSFELSVNGYPVFVDRGTYVYTSDPEKRNLYRGTRAHNVLSVNGAEHNRAGDKVFGLLNDTQTRVLKANELEIKARHTGFKTLMRTDMAHTRGFRFSETEQVLEVYDEVDGVQDGDSVEWFFHLSPELYAEFSEETVLVRKGPKLVFRMTFPVEMNVRKERFDHSPSYGRLQEAETLIFTVQIGESCSPFKARYLILWKV